MIRSGIFTLAALVVSMPALEAQNQTVGLFLNNAAKTSPGYVLMPPLHNGYTYLIDNNGQVVHSWNSGNYEPGRMAYLLPNGHLLRADSLPQAGPPIGGGEGGQHPGVRLAGQCAVDVQYATPTYAHASRLQAASQRQRHRADGRNQDSRRHGWPRDSGPIFCSPEEMEISSPTRSSRFSRPTPRAARSFGSGTSGTTWSRTTTPRRTTTATPPLIPNW